MIQKCMPPAWKQKIRLSLAQTKGVLLASYNQIIYQKKEQLELERLGCLRGGGAGLDGSPIRSGGTWTELRPHLQEYEVMLL